MLTCRHLPIHLKCQHHIDLSSLEKLKALIRAHPISKCIQNNDLKAPSCYFKRDSRDELISYAMMAIREVYYAAGRYYLLDFLFVEVGVQGDSMFEALQEWVL
jgi:hypothetical protein